MLVENKSCWLQNFVLFGFELSLIIGSNKCFFLCVWIKEIAQADIQYTIKIKLNIYESYNVLSII